MAMAKLASVDTCKTARRDLDVVVVGGGLAGVYALYRLRGLGFKARVYEAGSGVGGTWFWNRYPGARCDIESLEYSYSFSEELQAEWRWPERYATQPVILDYINHVADRFDLRRDIQLNTRIVSAVYDRPANRWTLTTGSGEVITARYCVMATGNLSTPRVPEFKGLESFQGKWHHSGLWPAEGVDFTGQRVGVIGTGSTAIQMIPLIAKQARHLTVFQRTANFSLPARNAPMDREREQQHKSEYARRREEARDTPFGVSGYPLPSLSALAAPPEERRRELRAPVGRGRHRRISDLLQRLPRERRGQRNGSRVRAREDPQHRARSQGRGAAGPEGSPDRIQAPLPRYRLLRDLQPRQRHPGRREERADPGNHADAACAPRTASTSSTPSSSRPGSTP